MNMNTNAKGTPGKTFGPYSPGRQAGNLFFTAGHIGYDATTASVSPDVATQARLALENLMTTLATAGLTGRHVVKTTLYLTDMADFAAVNEVYLRFFEEPRPARSTVGVKELPRVAGDTPIKIEIEAIAARNGTGEA